MVNRKVKIRYIKAYDFKAALATGVFGGITSSGLINANFFSDRVVIPDSQTIELNEIGEPQGEPIDQKDGDIVREMQSGVLMDVNTARVIAGWIQDKIKEHEEKIPKL